MHELTIVATITVDPERVGTMRLLFDALLVTTRLEKGCICYDLHQDNDDPSRFMFYETWESRTLWQDHMTAAHVKAFQNAADGIIMSVQLFEMTRLHETP